MNLMSVVLQHAHEVTKSGTKWAFTHCDFDGNVVMQIGLIRPDGIREVPHATRKYYEKDGEACFVTYPHC